MKSFFWPKASWCQAFSQSRSAWILMALLCAPSACSKEKPASEDNSANDDASDDDGGENDAKDDSDSDDSDDKGDDDSPADDSSTDDDKAPQECNDCSPPKVCLAGSCEDPGAVAVETTVGEKPGQVGLQEGDESAGEGPMSFAVRSDGKVLLLDQRNKRLQLFSGKDVEQIVELDSTYYQDVVFLNDDTVVLLDNYEAKELVVMSLSGDIERRVPLAGLGVEDPGDASGMYVRPDGLWVRYNYDILYLTPEGKEAKRTIAPAMISCDGKHYLSAELRKQQVFLSKRTREGAPKPIESTYEFEDHVDTLWMGSDCEGNTTFVSTNFQADRNDGRSYVLVFGPNWEFLRKTELRFPDSSLAADYFKEFELTPRGELYQLLPDADGVQIQKY